MQRELLQIKPSQFPHPLPTRSEFQILTALLPIKHPAGSWCLCCSEGPRTERSTEVQPHQCQYRGTVTSCSRLHYCWLWAGRRWPPRPPGHTFSRASTSTSRSFPQRSFPVTLTPTCSDACHRSAGPGAWSRSHSVLQRACRRAALEHNSLLKDTWRSIRALCSAQHRAHPTERHRSTHLGLQEVQGV